MALRHNKNGTSNGTTAVTVIPAPGAGLIHRLKSLVVTNKDTLNVQLIVRVNDNGTFREIRNITLIAGVSATATLTFSGNAANDETVEIGGKTYTFKTTIGSADGEVDVGINQAESEDQLTAAINLGAGGGTKYTSQTTAHPSVTAAHVASTVVVTAIATGAAGNAITVSEGMGSGDWGVSVLTGGVDATSLEVRDDIILATTNQTLEILLGWPVITTELDYTASYVRESL
ncbi:MAG: hypothetical protein IID41_00950 [Planctomycetes bacterium]|nr:hypothetical protein [Planctomycetota bacterium]